MQRDGSQPPTQALIGFIEGQRVVYGVESIYRVLPIAPSTSGLRPYNRTVLLLTLCGHFPSHIVERLLRRLVSDPGMASLPVVEDLDIFHWLTVVCLQTMRSEDCSLGLRARFEALTVNQFLFSMMQRSFP